MALTFYFFAFILSRTVLCAGSSSEVVERFVSSFDDHDVPAVLALVHPEVEWLSVNGSEVSVESRGVAALESAITSYFRSCPTCRASVEVSSVNGPFVTAIETATWESGGFTRSQSSTSVYEIVGGQVLRVWYYPAVKPPGGTWQN
jgi:hypothetical protein